MKHFFLITGMLVPVIFLSACKNAVITNENICPVFGFKSNIEIKTQNEKFEAILTKDANGKIEIKLLSPDNLKDLTFTVNNGENTISRGDLSYKTDKFILPKSSVIFSFIETLNSTLSNKNVNWSNINENEVSLKDKNFEIILNKKTGFINEIKLDKDVVITFSDQVKI